MQAAGAHGLQVSPQAFPSQGAVGLHATGSPIGRHCPAGSQWPTIDGIMQGGVALRQGGSITHSSPQALPSHGGAGGGGGTQSSAVSGPHRPWPSQAAGAGQGAPKGHGPSQRTPHALPAQVPPGHTKVPAVTHSPRALHAVAANVGTGQLAGGVPGGQKSHGSPQA